MVQSKQVDNRKPILLNEKLRPLHFLPWNIFKKKQNSSFRLNGVITYGLYKSPDEEMIVAFCGWTVSNKRYRENFVWSSYGYDKAKDWLEEKRKSLIEDLL